MTTPTEHREEIVIRELDQRYGSLRLSSPQELGRLRASVERMGVLHPVLVATAVETDRLVLVDGFKRVRVVTDRGGQSMWATRSPFDAAAAKVAMLTVNAAHQGLCDLEEAWIVRSLCREHKLTQAEVGKLLRRDKSWVCRRLMLAERLERDLQEDIRLGLLSSTVARELARLPRGNQHKMANTIRAHALTSRQAHRVVTALLDTDDPRARDDVLADPLRYLGTTAPEVDTADPRLGTGGNEVRRSLLFVHSAAQRLQRSTGRYAPAGLTGEEARILLPLVGSALHASRETTVLLERLTQDSGTPAG
jgi:ParB-like chromosome segregation protein Spo0J